MFIPLSQMKHIYEFLDIQLAHYIETSNILDELVQHYTGLSNTLSILFVLVEDPRKYSTIGGSKYAIDSLNFKLCFE